ETLLETNRHLLSCLTEVPARPGSSITPPCFIAPSAVVESSTIGPFVSIGERAAVRFSTLRNSIVSAGAAISQSVLEDSIVGVGAAVTGRSGRVNVSDSSKVSVS
ncbi:MAG: nucleotidyl transferase, partial [Limisphaerales bacterium]